MANFYEATVTYLNGSDHLTDEQLADKMDLFYMGLASKEEIFAVNALATDGEITVNLVFAVPPTQDAQDYAPSAIFPLISDAFLASSLNVKEKVATPVPAGV